MTEFEEFPIDFARIDEARIVVMTIPKAAHSSILTAMAATFALPGENCKKLIEGWRSHKSMTVPPDYLSVGFCRDPLDRFRSAWQNKIAKVDKVRAALASMGCEPRMSLDAFSVLVSKTEDSALDKHLVPQHYKFFLGDALRVRTLFRYEALVSEWESFKAMVLVHSGHCLADLPRINVSNPVSYQWSEYSQKLVRERYMIDQWCSRE